MDFSLGNSLGTLFVIGARVSGLMLFAPFMSNVAIPTRIKAALAVTMTVVLYPVFAGRVQPVLSPIEWPMLLGSEVLVGVAIGIATNLVFDAAEMAGQVFSVQMGFSLVNILDPQTQVDTTVLSMFTQMMALLIFLGLDIHHWILRLIAQSFAYLPPGSATPNAAFTQQLLHIAGAVFGIGLQIAAPVLASTLVADLLLGLIGKASPQMPVLFLGPAVKGLFGLVLLGTTVRCWPDLFSGMFSNSLQMLGHTLHLAR
ncbi:MAG TPA: flagellar biosynthetic protein FliR [Terriglobales bacterium]|nr:flagellar biosynthetic protein FliR [Terriglobales bacterium]